MVELEHATLVLVTALVDELGGRVPFEMRDKIRKTAIVLRRSLPTRPQPKRVPTACALAAAVEEVRQRRAARRRTLLERAARRRARAALEAWQLEEELRRHDADVEPSRAVARVDDTGSLFDSLE